MRLVRRGDHPGIIADQKSKVLLKQLTTPYHIHIPTLCNKDGGINYAKGGATAYGSLSRLISACMSAYAPCLSTPFKK